MKFVDLPPHHAILVTGTTRNLIAERFFKELEADSPVHRFFNQTVLDIETARTIVSWSKVPYHAQKVAIISFATAGIEAQNTMLKMLEEPTEDSKFVLLTTSTSSLLPTVLSRLHHIPLEPADPQSFLHENAVTFLQASHATRMKLPHIETLLKQVDEEGRKDREGIYVFILSLVEVLKKEKELNFKHILTTLETASFAKDPSSSGKALLEYLALLLPQIKD